jgi:two-component system copper resistance phosphate regulon response regulator CusR
MKILVVEDEPKLNKGITDGLTARGFAVDSAFDGEEGEKMARWNQYDLIILDVMMPKKDGFEVCRSLREKGTTTPIIMLTAKDAIRDRVMGLNDGADDYLVKPFAFEELVARIRSLLRRPALSENDVLELDELKLDTRSQKVTVEQKEIGLTMREYGLLEYLLRRRGEVLTRDDFSNMSGIGSTIL